MPGAQRIPEKLRNEYLSILIREGEEKVYRHALGTGIINQPKVKYPELAILDQAEAFFALYRQSGKEHYFIIGRCLRRAAHKLYRQQHKKKIDHPINMRFLNIIK